MNNVSLSADNFLQIKLWLWTVRCQVRCFKKMPCILKPASKKWVKSPCCGLWSALLWEAFIAIQILEVFSEKVCLRYLSISLLLLYPSKFLRWFWEISFGMFDAWDYMYMFLGDAVVVRSREISWGTFKSWSTMTHHPCEEGAGVLKAVQSLDIQCSIGSWAMCNQVAGRSRTSVLTGRRGGEEGASETTDKLDEGG